MVPIEYREFFVAAAAVAGASIGLLFVAISVRPAAAARTAHITVRSRSIATFSAFSDMLFLALRPRADLGGVCVGLGAAGPARARESVEADNPSPPATPGRVTSVRGAGPPDDAAP